MNIRIKRLHPDAVVPQYAHPSDSGFDLVAVEDVIIAPGETAKVPTGLAFEIPTGYELQVRPRSGVTLKTKLRVQLGTVDAGYRGEVAVMVDNIALPDYHAWYSDEDGYVVAPESKGYLLTLETDLQSVYYNGTDETTVPLEFGWWRPDKSYIIRRGDRIAQAVIAPVITATFEEVDELTETARGTGGFGSTGVRRVERFGKDDATGHHTICQETTKGVVNVSELKFRVFASDDLFPEGKMYYPDTMTGIDEKRGFVINQHGDLIHTRYAGGESRSLNHMTWARIGFNVIAVMLYTGLKDKNGTEIYDGDVYQCTTEKNPFVVKRSDELSMFLLEAQGENKKSDPLGYRNLSYGEIIGNVYENPELLTV